MNLIFRKQRCRANPEVRPRAAGQNLRKIALNLVTKAWASERLSLDMEQKAAALQLQATEARKDRAHTQSRLDQLIFLTEEEDETDTTLQQEVERLQRALDDLRLHTDQRQQSEENTRKELNERLQRAEALLERAETKIHQLIQQRHDLEDELDMVRRELRHAYSFNRDREGEEHLTPFPPSSESAPFSHTPRAEKGGESPLHNTTPVSQTPRAVKGQNPLQTDWAPSNSSRPTNLNKMARNIPTFAGDCSVHAYLQDIDFHLQTVANATAWDKLYLVRITSSREVRSFLDRQPQPVKADYKQLRQALIREFSDPESDQGFITALDVKQARLEHPHSYYDRLRQTFFGATNTPDME
ncbi:hypothetical protein PO909_004269, partial [Leuciscus waleckii]